MEQHTLLIATAYEARRAFLACQLHADGHTVHQARPPGGPRSPSCLRAVDVLILEDLEHPADTPVLLRAIWAAQQH